MISDLTFLTNESERKLSARLNSLLSKSSQFDCLVGYFYLSGFYLIEQSLKPCDKIRILIGLETEKNVYEALQQAKTQKTFSFRSNTETVEKFSQVVLKQLENADESFEVESGVEQFVRWCSEGKVEVRAYDKHPIHSKLYIFTFNKDQVDKGRVITGSSNLSLSGLQANLEFNVELKNSSDYNFAIEKFEELWKDSVEVSEDFVRTVKDKSHLAQFSPYELFLKFLYEYFRTELNQPRELEQEYQPENFRRFQYQHDAVLTAKRIVEEYKNWRMLEENLKVVAAHGFDAQTPEYERYTYPQSLISTYDNLSFFVASPELYKLMSDPRFTKFGNVGDAPHGLSTGDNKKYIRSEENVKGSHDSIEDWMKASKSEIENLTDDEKIKGFKKDWMTLRRCFVPLEKGGESKPDEGWLANYYVPTKYFINWTEGAIKDMKNNKGFAWKNERFYFKKGLTFSISGIYAPTFRLNSSGVFEAKGSGIFCDSIDDKVLLGIFCSMLARFQFKAFIKHSVDTSGDDIKEFRLPIIDTQTETKIKSLVSAIIEKQKANPQYPYHQHEQKEIDRLVYELYGLTPEQIREVEIWYCRRYARLAEAQNFAAEVREKPKDYLAHCELLLSKPPEYWTSHPITKLIARGENHSLDFKEFFGVNKFGVKDDNASRSTLKTLASFLNADGGTIFVGISDAGEITGIRSDVQILTNQTQIEFAEKIQNLIKSRFTPEPTNLISISFEHLTEGVVCRIDAKPSVGKPIYFDNNQRRRENRA